MAPYLGNVPSNFNVTTNQIDNDAVTSAKIADGAIVNADVNSAAAIAGTKISPDFGSQNTVTTGTSTAASLIPTGSTVPTNGIYLPAANTIAISTNSAPRATIDSSGRLLVGASTAPGSDSTYSRLSVTGNTAGGNSAGEISLLTATSAATVNYSGAQIGIIRFGDVNGNPFARIECAGDAATSASDFPGRLVFYTTADGAAATTERMRIDSSGRVGIGTTAPPSLCSIAGPGVTGTVGRLLQVYASSASGAGSGSEIWLGWNPSNVSAGGGVTIGGVYNGAGTDVVFSTPTNLSSAPTERARIDSSGRLLVGTSSARANFFNSTNSAATQIEGASNDGAALAVIQNFNGAAQGGTLILAKSNGSAVGSNTLIADANTAGQISFQGNDGTEFVEAARILAAIDGTPGANSMPGRIVLSTTASGASSPTERMRISQNGLVTIAGPGGGTFLKLANSGGYDGLHEVDNTAYTIGQNSNIRAMRIGSGANWLTTGVNLAAGGTSWGTYSDERLKTDIVELTGCLDNIKNIRCVSYRLTDVDKTDSKKRLGVIAQDLVGKYDEAVNASRRSEDDETEYLSVQYSDLVPVLLKALQEASAKIKTLEAKVAALEAA